MTTDALAGLSFAFRQYAQLAFFLGSCWGWGRVLLAPSRAGRRFRHPLAVILGMALMMCFFQVLAIYSVLGRRSILLFVGGGLLIAGWFCARSRRATAPLSHGHRGRLGDHWYLLMGAVLVVAPLMVAPLGPPLAWDEVSNHLPYARQWALCGCLSVNDWLRYPRAPRNFDILYAAALALHNDVLPHLLHAGAGFLTGWLIWLLALQYTRDKLVAMFAVVIWFTQFRWLYAAAYVDLPIALFALTALACTQIWLESGDDTRNRDRTYVIFAALCVGILAGIKYQALILVPLFVIVLLLHDRRASTWIAACCMFLLPCIYWYARNLVETGDPFSPIGGVVFGFTDWGVADYKDQIADIQRHAGWPSWVLWLGLAVPVLPAWRHNPALKRTFYVTLYMVAVWLVTSRYPRYLLMAYPTLALMSAVVVAAAGKRLAVWERTRYVYPIACGVGLGALFAVLAARGLNFAKAELRGLETSPSRTAAFISDNIPGYKVWKYLEEHPQKKIFQAGIDNAIYYAPNPIWGDYFGQWSYREYMNLPPKELSSKLIDQGFSALVINSKIFNKIENKRDFGKYFKLLIDDGDISLYMVN